MDWYCLCNYLKGRNKYLCVNWQSFNSMSDHVFQEFSHMLIGKPKVGNPMKRFTRLSCSGFIVGCWVSRPKLQVYAVPDPGLGSTWIKTENSLREACCLTYICQPSLKDMGGKNPTGLDASNATSVEVNLLRNLHTLKMFQFFPLGFSSCWVVEFQVWSLAWIHSKYKYIQDMEYMTYPGFLILLTSRMPTPPHVSRLKGQAGSWVGGRVQGRSWFKDQNYLNSWLQKIHRENFKMRKASCHFQT